MLLPKGRAPCGSKSSFDDSFCDMQDGVFFSKLSALHRIQKQYRRCLCRPKRFNFAYKEEGKLELKFVVADVGAKAFPASTSTPTQTTEL